MLTFCTLIIDVFSRHIQEDINAQQLPMEKKVEEMSEEERSYMYFKLHDLDGNDKLDGLEIFYSATHHSASEHDHNHEQSGHSGSNQVDEANENDNQASNESSLEINTDVKNLKLLELDENGQIVNKNINHIIGLYFTPPIDYFSLKINNERKFFFSIYRCVRQFPEFGRSQQ